MRFLDECNNNINITTGTRCIYRGGIEMYAQGISVEGFSKLVKAVEDVPTFWARPLTRELIQRPENILCIARVRIGRSSKEIKKYSHISL